MGCMDKGTVIERALSKLGDREFVERTATEDPVRRAYDFILRKANALHRWSFARVIGRKAEVKERDAEGWAKMNYIEIPYDCLRMEHVTTERGIKVRHSEFGIRPGAGIRIAAVEGVEKGDTLLLTYIADLIALNVEPPDESPYFCEGVICALAADLAMSIINNEQMAQAYNEEARVAFQRAIDNDARQWQSNDQHPLRGILRREILR